MTAGRLIQDGFWVVCRHLVAGTLVAGTGARYFNVPRARLLDRGLLLASNHQSFLDPILVGMALSRPVAYLARSDLFAVPGLGWLLAALRTYPVTRGAADVTALRTVIRLLRAGRPVVMFPEGTRSPDGALGPFRTGVAAIALRCGVPVLPVCVEGTYDCWPRTRALPRPARVAVAFGEPMQPAGRTADRWTQDLRAETQALGAALRAYLGRSSGT